LFMLHTTIIMENTHGIRHKITDFDEEGDYPDEYQILREEPVLMEKGFSRVIVIDNLPVIPITKFEKLQNVLKKICGHISGGLLLQIDMPVEDDTTKGFAFVEFSTQYAAAEAVKQLSNYMLDKSHILKVNFFDDFSSYERVSEEFVPEELPSHKAKGNLWWWLIEHDNRARDQYVTRYDELTEICWNGKKPELVHKKKGMTETYVTWSPYGTYLGTFHQQGIILWGGADWERVMRFAHPGVKLLDFSPQENYLVTFSVQYLTNDNAEDPQCIVWDVRSGRKLRGFLGNKDAQNRPVFKWSHDEKYFARLSTDTISIYETPSMGMLDKKSLKIPGVKDFSWSPTDNVIACWVPEESSSKPARVLFISIPSRSVIRSHNLFKVQECNLHWSSNGDYLCVKVDRLAGKKSKFTSFELCRLREKGIPIESLQMSEEVHAFAWEPKGHRFAVVHGAGSNKHDVSFYTMAGKAFTLLKKLDKRSANALFWSPRGGFIVLAGFENMGGVLEFYNVEDMESMRSDTHHMVTDLAWDPTGRFVATSTSYWRYQLDNGYTIWTFQGKMLCHATKDKFYQFQWRPRPPSLLSPEKQKQIEKGLRDYSIKYRKQDLERKRQAYAIYKKKRDDKKAIFYALKQQRLEQRAKDKALRIKLRGGIDSDDESQYYEQQEEVEELLSQVVETVEPSEDL